MYRILFIFVLLFSVSLYSQEKADTKYWIIFSDKGDYKAGDKIKINSSAYKSAVNLLSDRCLKRRAKVLSKDKLISFEDLPLYDKYIKEIEKSGIKIIARSRWFNGVSAYLTKKQIDKVLDFDFVSSVWCVKKSYTQKHLSLSPIDKTNYYDNIIFINFDSSGNKLNYGKSFAQISQINVHKVHNLNINGSGVMIAVFDSGFEWRNHEALKDLNITDEYDFINKDKNTFNEYNQKYIDVEKQSEHGTSTLSTVGGYKIGKLIGPAYNSEFILAKTEYTESETPMEEDFWLEAAEWAEAKGVDIITSSLIYKEFDEPYKNNSYEYENYNGNTAITTIAADRAAYLGVIVINALGNYMQTAIPSLGSPADGDSVISVGAVLNNGNIVYFSSNGPTSDGRIKPDVCALGVSVYTASNEGFKSYIYSDGTSFATPLTAGVCALILSAHPHLTPIQIREALRMTASNYSTPNNIMGWGIVNAYDALLYFGMAWSNQLSVKKVGDTYIIQTYLASNKLIDLNSVSMFYSTDNGNSFEKINLNFIEGNYDGNYSGKYEGEIENFNGGEILYYLYAKDMNGKQSVYPKDADKDKNLCFKVVL